MLNGTDAEGSSLSLDACLSERTLFLSDTDAVDATAAAARRRQLRDASTIKRISSPAPCPQPRSAFDRGGAPLAHISPLLQISPAVYEQRFWQSATYRRSIWGLDICFFAFVLVNNILVTMYRKKWPRDTFPDMTWCVAAYIALALLQTTWAAFGTPRYYQARPLLVAVNRLLRLATIVADLSSLRSCTLQPHCLPFVLRQTLPARPLHRLNALRVVFLLSCTYPTLIHTTYLRLHFKAHAAFQLAYLALTFAYTAVPAATLLSAPHFAPSIATICHVIDGTSTFLITEMASIPPAPTSVCSTPLAPWLVVLFIQLFVGFVAPLAVAYCCERRVKMRFLAAELRQAHLAQHTGWASAVTAVSCTTLLLVYGVLAWLLLLKHHRELARWALPADWPGADLAWYHGLVG